MALSKDELLKSRYKVIAFYPKCLFDMGEILKKNDSADFYVGQTKGNF